MLIVIQTPICLAMAVARYGKIDNTFVLLREDLNPARHRGRDIKFREELVVKLLKDSGLSYVETSAELVGDLIESSSQDLVLDFQISGKLWQNRIIPLGKGAGITRKVELLSFGADNLLPFSKLTDHFRTLLALRENFIWSKFLRALHADTLIVPAISHRPKHKFMGTELETIDVNTIFSLNRMAIDLLISDYLPMLSEPTNIPMIILSPDNLELNPKHISAIAAKANHLMSKLEGNVNVLVKPHPSTSNPSELIDFISTQLSTKPINQIQNIDPELLKSVPIEFLLLANNDHYFVGVPSSCLAFINPNRSFLVKTFDKKLDALYRRNYRFFLRFHQFDQF